MILFYAGLRKILCRYCRSTFFCLHVKIGLLVRWARDAPDLTGQHHFGFPTALQPCGIFYPHCPVSMLTDREGTVYATRTKYGDHRRRDILKFGFS